MRLQRARCALLACCTAALAAGCAGSASPQPMQVPPPSSPSQQVPSSIASSASTTILPPDTVRTADGTRFRGRIGPPLDAAHLPPLPADGLEVQLNTEPGIDVLVGLDGRVYGHLLGSAAENKVVAPDGSGLAAAPQQVNLNPKHGHCALAARVRGARYLLCKRGHVQAIVAGSGRVLADGWPAEHGLGFVGVMPSPDGRTLLAQWSGECEMPVAVFVPTGGGAPVTADGKGSPSQAVESAVVGWTVDGRAAVYFESGECGAGIPKPGIYLMTPGGTPRLIYATGRDPAVGGVLW